MAIFHRLLLGFLAVGMLIGVPLIFVAFDFSRESARLRTEQSITQQIAIVSANFEQEYGLGLTRSLKQITGSDTLAQYLSASQDERLVNARVLETSFLKSQVDYEIYSGIYFVDVLGQLVASVEDGKRVNWPESDVPASPTASSQRSATALHLRRLFERITTTPSLLSSGNMEWFMPPRQMVVEGPFVDERGRWSLLAGLPSLDFDNGALSGAAVIRVRLDTFVSRLKTITMFDEPVIWLFGPGGELLLKPEKSSLNLKRAEVGPPQMAKEVVLNKRNDDLLAYRDLAIVQDQPFLRITYGVPHSLLSRDFEPALYFFIAVLAISGVAVLSVAYFMAKNFSSPIIELAQAASRLARGELAGQVKVRSSGELMVLVDSFNRMSENLQRANETRSSAFAVLRKTAAQMQLPESQELVRLPAPGEAASQEAQVPGQEDAQDLRTISELIAQLITERAENLRITREARDSAEQANRAKSQFLANMSHEIRTPLNAVLGMLKLLQSTSLTSRQWDYVTKTEGAARSLLFLLNDILDFSKVEADKMTLDPRPFRLDQVMRDLSVILSASVGSKPVEVLFDIDASVPQTLVGDDLRLQQVLINLGGNAIKFTERGEVVIALRQVSQDGDFVLLEFSVRDTGIGIPTDQHAKIFDGFSQAEASTTRRFGGTGLGLAICQRLVGLMGGKIDLDSEPGRGSTFSFRISLPVVSLPGEATAATAAALVNAGSAPPADAAPMHALVVDDNATARQVLSDMVASLGWTVDVADSGPQAVALSRERAAQGQAYDVAFVDWQMPGMDGWETGLQMRQAAGSKASTLVMMVTAHGREMLSSRSTQEQASLGGFLVKPVTASMLLDAVRDARWGNAAVQAPGVSSMPGGRLRLAGLRLLIVEDNVNNRQVADELLRAEGAQVELAENGQRGLSVLESASEPFDAVLMDLQMPVMDGFTAAAKIRAEERWRALPVIAMTANAMASDREACLEAGMSDHVGKPFELDDLVAVVLKHTRPAAWASPGETRPAPVSLLPAAALEMAASLGVDVDAALQRLGGHLGTYTRMWRNFTSDLPQLLDRLASHCAASSWSDAAQEIHTLKGLAGMLGIPAVVQQCQQAERELSSLVSSAAALAWWPPLRAWADAFLPNGNSFLAALESAEPGRAQATPLLSPTQRLEELGTLAGLLQASDMKALDAFEPLRRDLQLSQHPAWLELQQAIDRLEFDEATRLVGDVMKGLRS